MPQPDYVQSHFNALIVLNKFNVLVSMTVTIVRSIRVKWFHQAYTAALGKVAGQQY